MTYREYMIKTIRKHWYFKEGELESLPESALKDVYEQLLDWIEE